MDLVDSIYDMTRQLPDEERFGLNTQMRRAATSIPSNIAEGYGRNHRKEYIQHLYIAKGSLMELEPNCLSVFVNHLSVENPQPPSGNSCKKSVAS